MIAFRGIRKEFEGKDGSPILALRDVDLEVKPGDFLLLTGPSGSGKSTLLFTAAGMQCPTAGKVMFSGQDVYGMSQADRSALRRTKLGFVFQTFNLIPYLTCLDNVALPAVLEGEPRAEAISRAKALLDRVGLGSRLAHKPAELSVGERQRAAVCRSLVNSPKVVLADEPTGNLDLKSAQRILDLFLEENSRGLTIVMATHDLRATKGSSRMVAIEEGRIIETSLSRLHKEDV